MVLFLASALPIRLRSGSWNVCVSAVLWWGVTVLSYALAPALSPPCLQAHRHCCCIYSTHGRWNQGKISGLYLPRWIIHNLVLTGSRPTVTEVQHHLVAIVDWFQLVVIIAYTCIRKLSAYWFDVKAFNDFDFNYTMSPFRTKIITFHMQSMFSIILNIYFNSF